MLSIQNWNVADELMLSRLRTKVLTKPADCDSAADCTDLGRDFERGQGHVADRKHVTGDVKMALIDKCSCGSPRLSRSLNRKLDPNAGSKSAKNEYTKATTDNRKKMTNAGHAHCDELANNAKNAALHQVHAHPRRHLTGIGMTSSYNKPRHRDSDDDSDVEAANRKLLNQKLGDDETGNSSNYTALNYDVNYVRVSPPKMTRRLKPQPEPETKMTREAQLVAGRAASLRGEAGTQPTEMKTPPVKSRNTQLHRADPDVTKNIEEPPTSTAPKAHTQLNKAGTSAKEIKPAPAEPDYIALSDLQASLAQSQVETKPEVDESTDKTEVVPIPEIDDTSSVKAKMFNDGENSFLQFTFTVKLDNKAAKKTGNGATDTGNSSVVSGTVNFVKSGQQEAESAAGRSDATITMKPVVSVHGGTMVGRDKPETLGSSAGFKLVNKPVGIAGIQLTHDDSRRQSKPETGSRPSSAGTQRSTHDQQLVRIRVLLCMF